MKILDIVGKKPLQRASLGMTVLGSSYVFSFYSEKASSGKLTVFREADGEIIPAFSSEMFEESRGRYSVCLLKSDIRKAGEGRLLYRFNDGTDEFADEYSKKLVGTGEYGKEKRPYSVLWEDGAKAFRTGSRKTEERRNELKEQRRKNADEKMLVFYKLHVRGFTKSETSKVAHPGTFAGVISKMNHITSLGFNAVLLMPVIDFEECMEDGRVNFWGYTGNGFFFAPKASYASDKNDPASEFAKMVDAFHEKGVSVYLEMMMPADGRYEHLREVLEFYHREYDIDGFRVFADQNVIGQLLADPYLSDVRIISDKQCDNIRNISMEKDFERDIRKTLKGDEGCVSGLFRQMKYSPRKGMKINYLADHDGFTLADVFSYDVKHNIDNGEFGKDGVEINHSWNCGAEGATNSRKIQLLRKKMIKSALMLLFTAQGIPMLMYGDECMRTQNGNNNAFCQDNETSYLDWRGVSKNKDILKLVQELISFRTEHAVIGAKLPLTGLDIGRVGIPDISFHGILPWQPDESFYSRTGAIMLSDPAGECIYIVVNAHWESHSFSLPYIKKDREAKLVFASESGVTMEKTDRYHVPERTVAVFTL